MQIVAVWSAGQHSIAQDPAGDDKTTRESGVLERMAGRLKPAGSDVAEVVRDAVHSGLAHMVAHRGLAYNI